MTIMTLENLIPADRYVRDINLLLGLSLASLDWARPSGFRPGPFLALVAGRLTNLTPLPLVDLALIAFGTPLVAAGAGWLFAGREPAVLARRPIE